MAGYDKQIYEKQAENMAAAFTDTGMFELVVKRKFQNRYDKVLVLSHFLVHVSYEGVYSNFSSTLCVFSLSSIRTIYSAQRNIHYPQRLHG
jgi:hypothetical protein